MSAECIPLTIVVPTHETSHISHDGNLVLTYEVYRANDRRQWIDSDENQAHGAKLIVSDSFNFVFQRGKTPLLQQLIKRARECFDPTVLDKTWVMETKPSGHKGYVTATIRQHAQPDFGDPILEFDDRGTNWLKTHFYS
jgi:hypothetical protein